MTRFDVSDAEGRTLASFPKLSEATHYAQSCTRRCDIFEIRTNADRSVDVALLFECMATGALLSTGRSLPG